MIYDNYLLGYHFSSMSNRSQRETVVDDPDALVLHFRSGEFGADVWTDAAGMTEIVEAIVAARAKAEHYPSTWQPQPVALYVLTLRPRIELGVVAVFPPGRGEGEYLPYSVDRPRR